MPDKITLRYDETFDIAFGKYRLQKNWQNKQLTWSAFINRISTTIRTAETHAEYMAADKPRQAEIKDVGGYVGGYLSGGRRKIGTALHRQLVTLDIDYAKGDFWADFELRYYCAAAMYSTHKHSPESPRLRLIVLLDREVKADEYQAIARKIAGNIDIELFDPTTFQTERLMYWPSTSKDGVYEFEYQDGPPLSADAILAEYTDWTDSSEWPVSARVGKIIRRGMEKQGDPLEKPGVVGSFCRAFSISAAIETHLTEAYEPCDIPDRYTYKHGSTGAGLVTYDDRYAYSHHGTDPISGKLCNAFDLVRLHKFGLKDEDAKADTPSNKLPSYLAMLEFATKIPEVRILAGSERLQNAREDFKGYFEGEDESFDITVDDEPENMDWLAQMEADRNNKYYSTINNIVLILENDPIFKDNIAYDDFEKQAIIKRKLPWRPYTYDTRYLTDMDDSNVEHYIEKAYGLQCTKLEKAYDVIYQRTRFHPVRDYLNAQTWDGKKRVDTLFIDYMGIEDSEYARAVTRKSLCACVARVMQPGIKFDYVATFVGPEGRGKSTVIDRLGGEWYSDSFTTVQGKEAFEQLQGVWILEMAELAGLKKADTESIKHFISKRKDRFRVAFGHRTEIFPRQCVPFGSTNKLDFMRGMSGNRRFWPLHITDIKPAKNVFTEFTKDEINQVWAEAVYLYNKKEPLFLSKELEAIAFKVQEFHTETDDRRGLIEQYLDMPLPANWDKMDVFERRRYVQGDDIQATGTIARDKVCAAEIWCEVLGGFQKDMTSQNTKFIHEIIRTLPGWSEFRARTKFGIYGGQKGYFKQDSGKYKHFEGVNPGTARLN